jgi:hypothetical protein
VQVHNTSTQEHGLQVLLLFIIVDAEQERLILKRNPRATELLWPNSTQPTHHTPRAPSRNNTHDDPEGHCGPRQRPPAVAGAAVGVLRGGGGTTTLLLLLRTALT